MGHPGGMSRRGIVDVLVYIGLTVLVVLSLLAALLTWVQVISAGLNPSQAFLPTDVNRAVIVENHVFWPSVTVAGETAPGVVETVTVTAGWWLVSPLIMIGLAFAAAWWRDGKVDPRPTSVPDDTEPIPVTS
jgi:hypothetical protein